MGYGISFSLYDVVSLNFMSSIFLPINFLISHILNRLSYNSKLHCTVKTSVEQNSVHFEAICTQPRYGIFSSRVRMGYSEEY
jgi:hypothetical protein